MKLYKYITFIELIVFSALTIFSDNIYIDICWFLSLINFFIYCIIIAYIKLAELSESKIENYD